MSYETLDAIADSYTPILFLLYLGFAILYWRQGDRFAVLRGLLGVLVCYVLMLIDNTAHIWTYFGLDYSTHTAVSYALFYFLIHKRSINQKTTMALTFSLMAYYGLMLYQQYHTPLDMMTTLLIIGPLEFILYRCLPFTKEKKNIHLRTLIVNETT